MMKKTAFIQMYFLPAKYFYRLSFLLILGLLMTCNREAPPKSYQSETLEIKAISDKAFLHVSFLQTATFGKVACNGLFYVDNGEAIVFDTPADNSSSQELIDWIEDSLGAKVKAVVINHFHEDCLGGLQAFHDAGVESFANNQTITLAKADSVVLPQNGFEENRVIKIGKTEVINTYFGPAHTLDNIISWIPSEKLIFGGCMVKSLDAGKGNTADADVEEWPKTIQKIKDAYPEAQIIIPGHGQYGDQELLDFTIELFSH